MLADEAYSEVKGAVRDQAHKLASALASFVMCFRISRPFSSLTNGSASSCSYEQMLSASESFSLESGVEIKPGRFADLAASSKLKDS